MPRIYKPGPHGRQYKRYSRELIEQAVREYKDGSGSIGVIAQKFDINKSVLYRHSTRNMKSQGGQTVLSKETELEFTKYINICAGWGYPFENYDLRLLVKLYLDKVGRTEKRFKDNMPGRDYATFFLRRHRESLSENIKQNVQRNRATLSSHIIKKYFEQVNKSISGTPIENILNYNEIYLEGVSGQKKILRKREIKYHEKVNNRNTGVSLMMACSAAGELLPPYIVYKGRKLYDTWTKFGPEEARYNTTESGWFDANTFEDWVNTIILPFFENKPGKKCLIGDNLSSHFSIDLIKKCHEKDVHFVFLPANSTQITQPLHVAFFGPMTKAWKNIILQWEKTKARNQSSIPKACFAKLLYALINKLKQNSRENIIKGFSKTGINPIDPSQVLQRLPDLENESEEIEAVDNKVSNKVRTRKNPLETYKASEVLQRMPDMENESEEIEAVGNKVSNKVRTKKSPLETYKASEVLQRLPDLENESEEIKAVDDMVSNKVRTRNNPLETCKASEVLQRLPDLENESEEINAVDDMVSNKVRTRKNPLETCDVSEVLQRLPNLENESEEIEAVDDTVSEIIYIIEIIKPKRMKKDNICEERSVSCTISENHMQSETENVADSTLVQIEEEVTKQNDIGEGKRKEKKSKTNVTENNLSQTEEVVARSSGSPGPYDIYSGPLLFEDAIETCFDEEVFTNDSLFEKEEGITKNYKEKILSNILINYNNLKKYYSRRKPTYVYSRRKTIRSEQK